MTTLFSDTILSRFIEFAINELGPAPARFCFLVFGSEGREEQTLKTDQDNALIFEDVGPDKEKSTYRYFMELGIKVCTWLNDAGYTFCEGNNMAMNPEYCQPLSVWMQYFGKWVHNSTPEDLLRTKIFFDFRSAYGEKTFAHDLRIYLDSILVKNPRFFQMLARNILPMAPPVGLFGNFVVETEGKHRGSFDIKSSMMPIVDFARIYALNNNIHATNTLERLEALRNMNILTKQNHQEMEQAYTYLMQMRLRNQARAIPGKDKNPDNFVRPKNLSYIEQKLLKEIFSQTKNFQSRLSYDFTGQIGGL
jgi:CBS domain-containing protein